MRYPSRCGLQRAARGQQRITGRENISGSCTLVQSSCSHQTGSFPFDSIWMNGTLDSLTTNMSHYSWNICSPLRDENISRSFSFIAQFWSFVCSSRPIHLCTLNHRHKPSPLWGMLSFAYWLQASMTPDELICVSARVSDGLQKTGAFRGETWAEFILTQCPKDRNSQ